MEFYKLSGAGNDFVVLSNMDGRILPESYSGLARALCRRRQSIGADGLMVLERSRTADFRMAFFNADGSAGEMCGNGARCICRMGYELGLSGEIQRVETPSGLVIGRRLDKRRFCVKLTEPSMFKPDETVCVLGGSYACAYVELGNPGLPHAVLEFPGLRETDLDALRPLAKALRFHEKFPKGANVNFYEHTAPDRVILRTYERGVEDFTLACGTGSASTALTVARRAGREAMTVYLDNPGGLLEVEVRPDEKGGPPELYLTGPTNIVARGLVTDEELHI